MDFSSPDTGGRASGLRPPQEQFAGTNAFSELPRPGDNGASPGPVLVVPPAPQHGRSVWLRRTWLVIFVLFCIEVGIILVVLPWTRIWTGNSILLSYPALREFLMNGFVRGAITGLGLVDLWMGISEAVSYREGTR